MLTIEGKTQRYRCTDLIGEGPNFRRETPFPANPWDTDTSSLRTNGCEAAQIVVVTVRAAC